MSSYGQPVHTVEGRMHRWAVGDVLHREDGPALYYIFDDGETSFEAWYLKGQKHRVGGPAYSHRNGLREWYQNDVYHRVDGPAIESPETPASYGSKEWYLNGLRHRSDGPAIEKTCGRDEWYQNGLRHRINGPAIDGVEERQWWVEGRLSRSDGPAIEYVDRKEWWFEGKRTRSDGPAIEYTNSFFPGRYFWDGIQLDDYDALVNITGSGVKG